MPYTRGQQEQTGFENFLLIHNHTSVESLKHVDIKFTLCLGARSDQEDAQEIYHNRKHGHYGDCKLCYILLHFIMM